MRSFDNIDAVILDKDGVFVDFQKLWLRVIAYRAQLIAEMASETSEMLAKVRAACIRAMGVDEDDETVDPIGPAAMPAEYVRLALATALFLCKNESDPSFTWSHSFSIVDESMQKTRTDLDIVEMSEAIEGSIEKIQEIHGSGLKLAVYTSDALEHAEAAVKKFGIENQIMAIQAGEIKTAKNYLSLCDKIKVSPENTLLITDSPIDLQAAKACSANTIAVFSGVIDKGIHLSLIRELADETLDSLADLDLNSITKKKLTI
jgi:phosphoglycolate phosphatase-like HAD superfamily hydrolase